MEARALKERLPTHTEETENNARARLNDKSNGVRSKVPGPHEVAAAGQGTVKVCLRTRERQPM